MIYYLWTDWHMGIWYTAAWLFFIKFNINNFTKIMNFFVKKIKILSKFERRDTQWRWRWRPWPPWAWDRRRRRWPPWVRGRRRRGTSTPAQSRSSPPPPPSPSFPPRSPSSPPASPPSPSLSQSPTSSPPRKPSEVFPSHSLVLPCIRSLILCSCTHFVERVVCNCEIRCYSSALRFNLLI